MPKLSVDLDALARETAGEVVQYLVAVDKELGLPAKCDGNSEVP